MPTVKELPASDRLLLRAAGHAAWAVLFACACLNAAAQDKAGGELPTVTISAKANPEPVEKSYRKMIRAMDLFDRERGRLSPSAALRFRLLPRRPDTDMARIEMEVIGATVDFSVPIEPDQTFSLERNQ